MALHGNTKLELIRDGKVIKRIEKHNDITSWVQNVIGSGNFQYRADPSKLIPIKQFFDGCLLTDKVNDASTMMIAGNSEVTAQAGNDSYTGSGNLKRGSFNTVESGAIAGGFRFVWDWNTSQGNGAIASVCLTRSQIGKAHYLSDGLPEASGGVIDFLHYQQSSSISKLFSQMTIIDYEKEIAYKVDYSSGTITVDEYEVNTKRLHLLGAQDEYILKETHSISQTVNNFSYSTASASYTGNKIHLITFSGNTLNDYSIDTTSWTVSATTHTYSGANFSSIGSGYVCLSKDAMPIIGDYIYGLGSSCTKIIKANLLGNNDADVTAYDNPLYGVLSRVDYSNGACVILPNGDWYKFNGEIQNSTNDYFTSAIYAHNSNFYVVRHDFTFDRCFGVGINSNNYGTQVWNATHSDGSSERRTRALTTMFPYVSTVNNLEEAVTKDITMYMKLTYEITEVST